MHTLYTIVLPSHCWMDDALLGVNWISVSHIAHATLEVHILFILSYVLIYLNQVESEAYYQVSVLH